MARKISEYFLYKHRFLFGRLFITTAILVMMVVAWLFVPGGLRQAELDSSVASGNLSLQHFTPQMVIDLPYHALQRLSFAAFDVSVLSIKLPSLLLGVGTIVGLYLLLRYWFRESITIPTVLVMVTMPLFLFMTQDATPPIYFQFISVWILLLATLISWRRGPTSLWKLLLFVAIGLACYTPLGVYLPVTLVIMSFIHPRVRAVFRRLSKPKLLLGVLAGLVTISPIIYAGLRDYTVVTTLLGIPTSNPDLRHNLTLNINEMFGFWLPQTSSMLTPIFSFGLLALMVIGLYRLTQVRYTARSYVTWIWLLILAPMVTLNPQYSYVLFILGALFVLRGLSQLLVHSWYRIFPRNAYARVVGAIPVALIVVALMLSSVFYYVYSYTYNPGIVQTYSKDLSLLNREITRHHYKQTSLVATPAQADFYRLVARYNQQFSVAPSVAAAANAETIILTHASHQTETLDKTPLKILTASRYYEADRFYIYNNGKE